MAKPETWKCPECNYERVKTTGALPETAACPRCGADMPELAAAIEAAKPAEPAASDPEA